MELTHPNYGFAKSKEEYQEDENPLPRAVSRSNSYQLLDGEWRFEIDTEDRGLRDGWHLGHHYIHTATWPGAIEEHMEEAKVQEGGAWHDRIVAWYEREFTLPEALDPQPVQTRTRLFGPYQSGGGAASLLRAIRRGMRARKASSPYDVTPSSQHQPTRQAANLRMQI